MIEFTAPSDAFRFEIDPATVTSFDVSVQGPGVHLFEGNADPEMAADPYAIKPDPLTFLSRCVAAGFFAPAKPDGPPQHLTVTDTQVDLDADLQTWSLQTENLHPGVFRLLSNILVAAQMDLIAITTAKPAPASDPATLPYPGLPQDMRFPVDYERPQVLGENRSIMISLLQPPSDPVLDQLYQTLESWWRIPLMGAYPRDDQSPLMTGLMPAVAYLQTPTQIYQGLEIAFVCDEAAFVSCVTALQLGVSANAGIAKVTIR